MVVRETSSVEHKEAVSASFLKTVSAYANYGTGKVVFGVTDDGETVGVPDPVQACLDIENRINDSIEPVPRFTLDIDDAACTVTLIVYEGSRKPYLCRGKAYRRADSASVAVDSVELGRLALEGSNQTFDEFPSKQQDLAFDLLADRFQRETGIERFDKDVMRTLELYRNGTGCTNAAALLADKNAFKGVDVVRFGDTLNDIHDRATYEGVSVLAQREGALDMFERYYTLERIEDGERKRIELVPADAFREALANALVHRTWDIAANINIAMYPDRIEVTSPGTIPSGLTTEEYLGGRVSVLRNPILANVFFRLRYIENFGTGIMRINECYAKSAFKPVFNVRAASIVVTLPVVDASDTQDERTVRAALSPSIARKRGDVERATGFGKDKVIRILGVLIERGVVEKLGGGRGTRYRLA